MDATETLIEIDQQWTEIFDCLKLWIRAQEITEEDKKINEAVSRMSTI